MTRQRAALWLAVLLVILVGAWQAWKLHADNQRLMREAHYQSTLRAYSSQVKLGSTRLEVERYLDSNKLPFNQICCVNDETAYADIVKIGEEDAPWYCGEHNIYIAFDFHSPHTGRESAAAISASPEDSLVEISRWGRLENCL